MTQDSHPLNAISPLDGRYAANLQSLRPLVSEGALIRQRVRVECAWLLHLASYLPDHPGLQFSTKLQNYLGDQAQYPSDSCGPDVKGFETTTNHDVKAVEYYLRQNLTNLGASPQTLAMIHFACTSEDINNLSYALILNDCRRLLVDHHLKEVMGHLIAKVEAFKGVAMLSRTHGQPATPTTLGKEIAVFGHRLNKLIQELSNLKIEGKINGAVGNFNAHIVAIPTLDWPKVAQAFVEDRLGLTYNPMTTQIENHDSMVAFSSLICRINNVLLGLCRDFWGYISIGYLKQKAVESEVGSSTMPHKVNPIDFENAEGNFGLANSLGQHFCDKLPISRWQRDLSDSTVQRNLGTFFGHSVIGYRSLCRGLSKVEPNPKTLTDDLSHAPEVLGEAIQTLMRHRGIVDAYERLKQLSRGRHLTEPMLHQLIADTDQLTETDRKRLRDLTPATYTGLAEQLCDEWLLPIKLAYRV